MLRCRGFSRFTFRVRSSLLTLMGLMVFRRSAPEYADEIVACVPAFTDVSNISDQAVTFIVGPTTDPCREPGRVRSLGASVEQAPRTARPADARATARQTRSHRCSLWLPPRNWASPLTGSAHERPNHTISRIITSIVLCTGLACASGPARDFEERRETIIPCT